MIRSWSWIKTLKAQGIYDPHSYMRAMGVVRLAMHPGAYMTQHEITMVLRVTYMR